jgi:hypothetical protein
MQRGMLDIQTLFLLEFGSNIMCHNPMKSIILENLSQSHRIVTHQVGTKF